MQQVWAGSYDCATCGRKRLLGEDFSKSALEKHRRDPTAALRCKTCVAGAAEAERLAAAQRQGAAASSSEQPLERCAQCARSLPCSSFNRSQLSKGADKQRCQECVALAEKAAISDGDERYAARLAAARVAMQHADAAGTPREKLATASAFAAIEAERVTGLKPVKMGSAIGRGRVGGRGLGRGRSGP